jgi:uncharacterized membrane protein HdeD (DUF308 family)
MGADCYAFKVENIDCWALLDGATVIGRAGILKRYPDATEADYEQAYDDLGITALTLLYLIAIWAIITGVFEIMAAIRLREEIDNEWFLALTGIASLLFGALILMRPGTGVLAVLGIIAGYAIVFGVLMIILGLRLRTWTPTTRRSTRATA